MNDEQKPNPSMGDLPDIEAQQSGAEPAPKPARASAKKGKGGGFLMTLILLLVILFGGYYLFKNFVKPKEEKATEDAQYGFSSSLEEKDFDALIPAQPVTLDGQAEVASNAAFLAVNTRIANLEAELVKLSAAMKSQLDLMSKQGPGSAADALPALQKIESAVGNLNTELNLLKDSMAEFDEKYVSQAEMNGLVTRVKRLEGKHSKARKARARAAAVKLPFQMVSVDLWNGRKYAAVSMQDKISLLAVGDALMGWWVDSLDYKGQMAVFKNHKGQSIKKHAQR